MSKRPESDHQPSSEHLPFRKRPRKQPTPQQSPQTAILQDIKSRTAVVRLSPIPVQTPPPLQNLEHPQAPPTIPTEPAPASPSVIPTTPNTDPHPQQQPPSSQPYTTPTKRRLTLLPPRPHPTGLAPDTLHPSFTTLSALSPTQSRPTIDVSNIPPGEYDAAELLQYLNHARPTQQHPTHIIKYPVTYGSAPTPGQPAPQKQQQPNTNSKPNTETPHTSLHYLLNLPTSPTPPQTKTANLTHPASTPTLSGSPTKTLHERPQHQLQPPSSRQTTRPHNTGSQTTRLPALYRHQPSDNKTSILTPTSSQGLHTYLYRGPIPLNQFVFSGPNTPFTLHLDTFGPFNVTPQKATTILSYLAQYISTYGNHYFALGCPAHVLAFQRDGKITTTPTTLDGIRASQDISRFQDNSVLQSLRVPQNPEFPHILPRNPPPPLIVNNHIVTSPLQLPTKPRTPPNYPQ